MTELNEYTKQGIDLRTYIFQRIGEELFAERRRRGHTINMVGNYTNISPKLIDKTECGVGKFRWTTIALLLKHYKKQITIKLTDIPKE